MNRIEEYIESGILEMYVLGETSPEETSAVEAMAADHEAIRVEIDRISVALESYAQAHGVKPNITVKPFIMAGIDYAERMKNGEPLTTPPSLTENSRLEEYASWLDREDMIAPVDFDEIYAKIIGYTAGAITAIVWIRNEAPEEIHHKEYEKFLIVEGACDILIGDELHQLGPGDYRKMPLHIPHQVRISSDIPCKLILQRETVEA